MNSILGRAGYRIQREDLATALESQYDTSRLIEWLDFNANPDLSAFVLTNFGKSHAQLQQDLVAEWHRSKSTSVDTHGVFVEFGATDGITLSNTFLLEKKYGWNGILCEPARSWSEKLFNNRNCKIDKRCVFSESSLIVNFSDVAEGELSSISEYAMNDKWAESRKNATNYEVETVSLRDLLLQNGSPMKIDYLSIDTEGSEYEIIKDFDFNEWKIGFISIEHNYSENREKIFNKLSEYGYVRNFTEISLWDDWYFKSY